MLIEKEESGMRKFSANHLGMTLLAAVCLWPVGLSTPPAHAAATWGEHAAIPAERTRHFSHVMVDSSVKIDPQTMRRASLAAREAFAAVIKPYARVSPEQARLAIEKIYPGLQIQDISLNAVHENLVYIALLGLSTPGMRRLVFVDAGNARILATRDLPVRRRAPMYPM
jgi:hypothetical protein